MSQALATTDARTALLEAQHSRFIKNMENSLEVIQSDDGPSCVVAGEEVPLLDMAFDLQIVQPGHVHENKNLAKLVGNILVLLEKERPEAEYSEEMLLMPIAILNYGQRYFDRYEGGGSDSGKLICWSIDGVLPSDRVPMPQHHACSEVVIRNGEYSRNIICPFATWDGDEKPSCRTIVSLAFLDMERKIPVRLQLHGKAIGEWNKLQRAYKQAKNVARLKKKSINDYLIKLSIRNEGTYVVPEFRLLEATPETGRPTDWLPVCKYYMQNVFSRAVEDVKSASPAVAVTQAPELAEDVVQQAQTDGAAAQEFSL